MEEESQKPETIQSIYHTVSVYNFNHGVNPNSNPEPVIKGLPKTVRDLPNSTLEFVVDGTYIDIVVQPNSGKPIPIPYSESMLALKMSKERLRQVQDADESAASYSIGSGETPDLAQVRVDVNQTRARLEQEIGQSATRYANSKKRT